MGSWALLCVAFMLPVHIISQLWCTETAFNAGKSVKGVKWSSNSSAIIFIGNLGGIYEWNIDNNVFLSLVTSSLSSISVDGDSVVIGYRQYGGIMFIDSICCQPWFQYNYYNPNTSVYVVDLCYLKQSPGPASTVLVVSDWIIYTYSNSSGYFQVQFSGYVISNTFIACASRAASIGGYGVVTSKDILLFHSDNSVIQAYKFMGPYVCTDITFRCDGFYPVISREDGHVFQIQANGSYIWDIFVNYNGVTCNVTTIDISVDGNYLGVGCDNNAVFVYHIDSRKRLIYSKDNRTDRINEVNFSPDGQHLAVADDLGYVRLIPIFALKPYHNSSCMEICGDGYNIDFQCDYQKGIPLDGCNDDCTMMDNYTCSDDNHVSFCWYLGHFSLKTVSIKRTNPENVLRIVIQIDSLAYLFRNLSSQELNKLFVSEDPSLESVAVVQMEDGQFQLIYNIKADINSDSFQIKLSPSSTTNRFFELTDDQLFDVPCSQFNMTPIYFYSQSKKNIYKTVFSLSIIFIGLSFVIVVLSLYFRRLSALQMIFVIQIAWVSLMWLNNDLLFLFEAATLLRFFSGYNIQMISQNSIIAKNSPFTYQFGMSNKYFVNNFNLMLFLQILLLVCYFLVKVKLKMQYVEVKDSEETLRHLNSIEVEQKSRLQKQKMQHETKFQEEKLKWQERKQYVCFALMYLVMFNTVMKTQSGVIFYLYGDMTSLSSHLFFFISIIITVFVFVMFFRYPPDFLLFQTEFRETSLALHHYFIHFVVLTGTVIAISFCSYSKSFYLSFVPLLLPLAMCLYTIVYRPYISIFDNLRSFFCYFTMCLFIALKVFIQNTSKDNLNTNTTYFLFIGCFCLLPLILIITCFVDNYKKWHYLKYVLPGILKAEADQRERNNNVLKQLVVTKLNKKMQSMPEQNIFKRVVDAKSSLKQWSNRVKNEQIEQRQKMLQQQKVYNQYINVNISSSLESRRIFKEADTREASKHKQFNLLLDKSIRITKLQRKEQIKEDLQKQQKDETIRREETQEKSKMQKSQEFQHKNELNVEQLHGQQQIVDNISKRVIVEQNQFINTKEVIIDVRIQIKMSDKLNNNYISVYEDI